METDGAKFFRWFPTTWQCSALWVVISLWWGLRAVGSHDGWMGLMCGVGMLMCSVFYLYQTAHRFRARSAQN